MKIIVSPSKTQMIKMDSRFGAAIPEFAEQAENINTKLKKLNKKQLKKMYKASDKIVDEAHNSIHEFAGADEGQAIFSYTGAVFNNMAVDELNDEQVKYLNDTLVILSAHYGVLKPFDLIKNYRLDYKMQVLNMNLKDIWQDKVNDYLEGEVTINLASAEFSNMIKTKKIDIEFKELRDGKYKIIGTYAKMARGRMINMIAKNMTADAQDIKRFSVMGYEYNEELSNEKKYVFTK